jgi:hypothetical protein
MELPRFPGGLTVPQEWLDGISTQLRATGVDIVKQTLLTVMTDFFTGTNCWRMWVGPVVVGGEAPPVPGRRVPIPPPDTKIAIRIVYDVQDDAGWGLRPLEPTAYPLSDERLHGKPLAWYQTDPGVLVLDQVPPPDQASVSLQVYASLTPIDLCIPPAIHAEHYDALCSGVLARLTAVKGPNFNMQLSSMHRTNYIRARSRAAWNTRDGYSARATRVLSPVLVRGSQRRGQVAWRT